MVSLDTLNFENFFEARCVTEEVLIPAEDRLHTTIVNIAVRFAYDDQLIDADNLDLDFEDFITILHESRPFQK